MNTAAARQATGGARQAFFSIVIPAYNAADWIDDCLAGVLSLATQGFDYEVILVDDCSSDATFATASCRAEADARLRVYRTQRNGGPGAARNVGMAKASGTWLLFLDSDDFFVADALVRLKDHIDARSATGMDIVGFDWVHHVPGAEPAAPPRGERKDAAEMALPRAERLKKYLALRMDGSVIYTAIGRELVARHGLQFAPGYHEDVDFIFKVYWHAVHSHFLDAVLYRKRARPDSIVHSITRAHIDGFMRAWNEIGAFLAAQGTEVAAEYLPHYRKGLEAVLATRARAIFRHAANPAVAADLYEHLYLACAPLIAQAAPAPAPHTRYERIAAAVVAIMTTAGLSKDEKGARITAALADLLARSWSCQDLHHSVFLAPGQIRTCCKRFFVDGEMRGDVVLFEVPADGARPVTLDTIFQAKASLHAGINAGDETDCDGCPFLEFRDWGDIGKPDVRYLSFEYHSVCNLKCTYCSETYYGGAEASYDVAALVDGMIARGALSPDCNVVWGGGEPVVDKDFPVLLHKIADALPGIKQRVLTNAVKYSTAVDALLARGQATITTSIDAGSAETFTRVRGKAKLNKVLANLERYAAASAEDVTVKYIFTEGNESLAEVRGFVALVREHRLTGCNLQISGNFKYEGYPRETLLAMIVMYGLLQDAGCRLVFFDDLIRQRLSDVDDDLLAYLKDRLAELNLDHILADAAAYRSVIIWGAGWQARHLLERSHFFRHVEVAYLVDSTPAKIGGEFMGHPIRAPEALRGDDLPVLLAAVQNYPALYGLYRKMGLSDARLVKGLIL